MNTKRKTVVNKSSGDVNFALYCHLAAEIDFPPLPKMPILTFKRFEIEGRLIYLLNTKDQTILPGFAGDLL